MRHKLTKAILVGLIFVIAIPASAINRNDLIACRLGQQPEGVVCPVD